MAGARLDADATLAALDERERRDALLRRQPRVITSYSIHYTKLYEQAQADQQTPDLRGIIQEIVERADWSSGQGLALIITGTGTRTAEAFDGEPTGAPLLHVVFGAP